MKIINEAGIFATLANKIRAKRETIKKRRQDQIDNKDEYAIYDQMVDNLASKHYNNTELNLLQRYLLISKNYDGSTGADINQNMLYDAAMNNKLDVEKIKYLGQVASSISNINEEDFNFLSSSKTVDQMKALYYAHSKNIPFKEIGSFNGKPPSTNHIINVIRNYEDAGKKEDSAHKERLSFLKAKGYSVASFLLKDAYEDVDDSILADSIVALVLGNSEAKVKSAIQSVADLDKANKKWNESKSLKEAITIDVYKLLGIDDNIPHYSLDQLRNKSIQTLRKELNKYMKSNSTAAQEVNNNEANNPKQR